MKAYKFKIRRSGEFESTCSRVLAICRELYNAGLQERREAYRIAGKTVSYAEQCRQLTEIRAFDHGVASIYSQVGQDALRRLNRAFEAFFRRCKTGRKPGHPRFKGATRYDTFTYPQHGFSLIGDTLILSKIGSCRLRLSRPVEGNIKTCTIKREVNGWYAIFVVEETQSRWFPRTGIAAGADMGISLFATLSTGEEINNPRFMRTAERFLKRAQRKVSKKQRGGRNRQKAIRLLARRYRKIKCQRLDFFHKTSLSLIRQFDHVVFEDLNIAGMVKNHRLAKSITDAAWGIFLNVHFAKAENAGRSAEKVNPYRTSQDCCECGARMKLSLAQRTFHCTSCGSSKSRDLNASINIKLRGRAGPLARAAYAT